MNVKIQLFAYLKEELGESVEIEMAEPVTATGLMRRFLELYPQFKVGESSLNLAVDQDYVREDREIRPGAEVAIFPPVSGGWR